MKEKPAEYKETHYDRAGYGKLGFRCDLGPTAFAEVRQAICYTINRPEFAQTFTGGFGSVVHGPYYTGFSAYKAVEDEIILNQYAYSSDSANAVLDEGGWIYNDKGQPYVAGTPSAIRSWKAMSSLRRTSPLSPPTALTRPSRSMASTTCRWQSTTSVLSPTT